MAGDSVILFQCRMLRASPAYFDSSKRQQACAFELEHVLEEALRSDFGPESEPIKEQWEGIDPSHPYVEEHNRGRPGLYCSWGKAERRRGLAGLLASLDPAYPRLYPMWVRNGAKDLVSPQELDKWDGAEWPDPNW